MAIHLLVPRISFPFEIEASKTNPLVYRYVVKLKVLGDFEDRFRRISTIEPWDSKFKVFEGKGYWVMVKSGPNRWQNVGLCWWRKLTEIMGCWAGPGLVGI